MMGLRSVMRRADVGRESRRRHHPTVWRALMQEPKNHVKIAGLCAEIDHARTTTSRRLRAVPRPPPTPAGSDSGDSMLAPPSGSCSRPSRRWPRRIPHVFFIFLNFNLSRASRPPHRAPTPRVGRCQSCLLVIVSQCLLSSARSHAPVTLRNFFRQGQFTEEGQ